LSIPSVLVRSISASWITPHQINKCVPTNQPGVVRGSSDHDLAGEQARMVVIDMSPGGCRCGFSEDGGVVIDVGADCSAVLPASPETARDDSTRQRCTTSTVPRHYTLETTCIGRRSGGWRLWANGSRSSRSVGLCLTRRSPGPFCSMSWTPIAPSARSACWRKTTTMVSAGSRPIGH